MAEPDQPPRITTRTSPVPVTDRLAAIDILRGIALFGVMAINVVFEFRVSIFQQFLTPDRTAAPLDRAVESFLDHAIEMKAFALFSLLFGIGLAIQFERIDRERRLLLLLRRLLVLLGFGLVHLTLIWNGDILTEYALAGFLTLPFLFGPRWLLAASCLTMLGTYFSDVLASLVHLPGRDWMVQHVRDATRVYGSGGISEIIAFRLHEISAIAPLHVWIFPRTLGLFLLGALIWRCGVLQRATDSFRSFVIAGLAALVISIDAGSMLATVTLALAYAAIIIGTASTPLGARLLGWTAPLGRMAFTNYLVQSLIFGFVFYGYGLGLFGKLGAAAALSLGSAVYLAQVLASRWWMGRFSFGPVEWLWRTLMYGRRPPIRSASRLAQRAVAAA